MTEAQKDKLIYALSIVLSRLINRRKKSSELVINEVLLIRRDEIGDLCYTLPAIEALKLRLPNARISFWCRPFAEALLKAHPSINEVFSDEKGPTKSYDLVVDLRGKWEGLQYAFRHRPRYRLERGIVRLQNRRKGRHPHELETNLQVLADFLPQGFTPSYPFSFPIAETDRKEADEFIEHQLKGKAFALLHPGARRELRRWPAARYALLIDYLQTEYGLEVVLSGDSSERDLCASLIAGSPRAVFNLAGETSLPFFVALAGKATLFVGNESGPLHLAAVQGVRSIGLFGPGEPHVFYPPAVNSRVLHQILDCNPCDQIHCVHPDSPCISRIQLTEVKAAIDSLLRPVNSPLSTFSLSKK